MSQGWIFSHCSSNFVFLGGALETMTTSSSSSSFLRLVPCEELDDEEEEEEEEEEVDEAGATVPELISNLISSGKSSL